MSASREPQSARSIVRPSRLASIAAGSALVLTVGGLAAAVGQADVVTPRSTPALPSRAAQAARQAAGPTPVAPKVTEMPVASVAATKFPANVARTAPDQRGSELVAHVRARVHQASVVGVTWSRGTAPDGLVVRVRALRSGRWSDWKDVHVDPGEGPSADEETTVRDGTEPIWIGAAESVEVAAYSPDKTVPQQMRLQAIDPGTAPYDAAPPSQTKTATTTASKAGAFPAMPNIVTRSQWGADESLGDRCWAPRLGSAFKMVFVHHTVGSNTYSRSESAAVVRGIYAYHTESRGWCDIGYNFLVDRYGTVFEGRDGGIRQPVRGAHAGDFNTDTTGISLMGNFETGYPTAAMKSSLVRLIAWRMGTAYRNAYGGAIVEGSWFRRISGHRDAMSTACPGEHVYSWLPRLRERVADQLGSYQSKIEQEWVDRGGPKSSWGPVRIGEQHEHHGGHTTFDGGRMYRFDHETLAFRRGPVLTRFVRSGEIDGDLGYPVSETRTPRNGEAADFEHGSIYWSISSRSHILKSSAIMKRYRALGGATSDLAFPTSPVLTTTSGAKANFQHGTITFDKSSKRLTVTYE
ncbi:MAG: N-acetylmuramoyl-L-alanine amidase [Nocardioidaceae bacterium]|nr:N-acetylmuramoyl-L-alanine amidase [Nocardioidaceae bacterium]